MEVLFETAKVTALQRIAAASKRRDDWAAWRLSSERSIDRWAGLSDSSMEYVGLQNHINGVREHYSQVLSRLELPDDAVTNDHAALQLETESLLREHDRLVARGKVIAAQASVDPESRRHAVINGLLFDHFSREPAPPFDAGVARQALAQVKPEAGHESQQYRAQWLQVSGLVELRDEQSALGIAKLAEALNIWHNQRNIAKERELVGDLLHALKDDPDRREASMELLFRWAGLRLLQSPFDLSAAHRPLLSDVVQRLHREHLLAADMLPASLRPK